MRALVCSSLLIVLLAAACGRMHSVDVIVDHDGGVGDFVAISLLMKSSAVRVKAITVCPADCYLEPATRATQLYVDKLGGEGITIAQGHSTGTNSFPDEWRKDAGRTLTIESFRGMAPTNRNRVVTDDAAHHLVSILSTGKNVILETGPLTNIADALRVDPAIRSHISRIYIMGGAVHVRGNVVQPGHDGSAEWNIYNNPTAAAEVIESGIPITLIPLDATNQVPLTLAYVDRMAAQPSIASQLAAQSWRLLVRRYEENHFYFWDELTAAALLDRGVITSKPMRIRVITEGPSQGRTAEDPNGALVEVAVGAHRERVEKMFLDLLGR